MKKPDFKSPHWTSSTPPPSPVTDLARSLLREIGENPDREGLLRTPERFEKAFRELTEGYAKTGLEAVGEGIFESESSGPVCVRQIEFFSLCEHHLLPFWGRASIAYLPGQKILGLSKLARIVDVFARRLQVQERLTAQIGECIRDSIQARAVVVSVEAQHMCMMMRGVRKIGGTTATEFAWKSDGVSPEEMGRLFAQLRNQSQESLCAYS